MLHFCFLASLSHIWLSDYVDADILSRIDDLDREEEERLLELSGRSIVLDTGLTQEQASTLGAIRNKKKLLALQRRMNPNTKGSKHTAIPRMVGRGPGPAQLDRELEEMGAPFDSEVRVRARSHASIREGRDASRAKSRERSRGTRLHHHIILPLAFLSTFSLLIIVPGAGTENMGDDSRSRSRSHSRTPSRMDLSVHSEVTKKHLLKLADKSVRATTFLIYY
jgi:hypothetical protein